MRVPGSAVLGGRYAWEGDGQGIGHAGRYLPVNGVLRSTAYECFPLINPLMLAFPTGMPS